MKAVLCPVCQGSGITHFYASTGTLGEECHTCKGRGWVEVSNADDRNRPAGIGCPIGSHYGSYSESSSCSA